jgi:hypothetical protein
MIATTTVAEEKSAGFWGQVGTTLRLRWLRATGRIKVSKLHHNGETFYCVSYPADLGAAKDQEEGVEHWHLTSVVQDVDADGEPIWTWGEIESPVLAEDWRTYQPYEAASFHLN